MVKAKDFWNYLCVDLNYRFFAGVPCNELKVMYSHMKSDFMHYIPANSEDIALGISSGVWLDGIKSGVLMSIERIPIILSMYTLFNTTYKIPVLLLVGYTKDEDLNVLKTYKIPYKILTESYVKDLVDLTTKLEKTELPQALLIKEGVLK